MTIKEFSLLCSCTTQTLRYYDSINLLKPARVDQFSGYRYYDSEQALDYVKIKNLQEAMFSIEEIKELLECDDDEIVKAFDVKIAEQEARLKKIIQIQMSYRNDYMKMQEMIKKTRDKINESVGNYDAAKEYGISNEYYRTIIEKMNAQYEQAMSAQKDKNFRFDELSGNSMKEPEAENPLREGNHTVVFEESGWKNTSEILEKLPTLEGKYILYFELNDEKWTYNDFCVVVISIVQDRNRDRNININCTRRRSKDGKNHFWLLRQ